MLIAEIGNNHFGDIEVAKEMIRTAHNCGADLIKMQAFTAYHIRGSMPLEFYQKCQFSEPEYLWLIDFARELGNDLFYSIFAPGFEELKKKQAWRKVAGSQTQEGKLRIEDDADNLIVSVPVTAHCPRFKLAAVLHVSEYCTTVPHLWHIETLAEHIGRPAGYSDHCIGIETAIEAHDRYGANVIEKHFTLKKNISFKGKVFRDTVHAADPFEFEALAKELSR